MKPTPNAAYRKMQEEFSSAERKQRWALSKKMESEFVAAWGFGKDRLRLAVKLRDAIGLQVRGFDHCSFYTGHNDQRIIVTQPYGDFEQELRRSLTLGEGAAPEVVNATEWAFYYPGEAQLLILKFPPLYAKSLEKYCENSEWPIRLRNDHQPFNGQQPSSPRDAFLPSRV